MLLRKGKFKLVLPVLFLAQSMAWAEGDTADSAGQVKFANGDVKIVSSGSEQPALKGSLIKEGDTIITDISGSAQLDMKDKGIISVRPDSQLQIVTYKMNSDGKEGRAIFRLLKGSFRSITGLIGTKTPANYAVETPAATIGIGVKGTDHEPQFVPPSGWLVAPGRSEGTYDTVYSGKTVLSAQAGQIELASGETGYAPRQEEPPHSGTTPKELELIRFQMAIDKYNLSKITPAQLRHALSFCLLSYLPDFITKLERGRNGSLVVYGTPAGSEMLLCDTQADPSLLKVEPEGEFDFASPKLETK